MDTERKESGDTRAQDAFRSAYAKKMAELDTMTIDAIREVPPLYRVGPLFPGEVDLFAR